MKILQNKTQESVEWTALRSGEVFVLGEVVYLKLGATFQRGGKDYNCVNLEGGSMNLIKDGTKVSHVKDATLRFNG